MNSPFGYREFPFAYDQYALAMYQTLMDPGTLIFLDTNVLGIPFRMHTEARKGFYQILQKPIQEKRIFVPGWVCNEYFFNGVLNTKGSNQHGFSSDTTSSSIPASKVIRRFILEAASSQEISSLGTKLGVPAEEAAQALSEAFDKCSQMIKSVGKDRDPNVVHQELFSHLQECCLSLNFGEHLSIVTDQAARRRNNRIPPGLTDENKDHPKRGSSAGNADGDLAIWLEILDRCETFRVNSPTLYKNIIVLCEEKKSDFFYSPMRRRVDSHVTNSKVTFIANDGPRLTLIDPRLVSEFEARIGHRNVGFVRVEHIISGLSTNSTGPIDPEIRSFIISYQEQTNQPNQNVDPAETVNSDGPSSEKQHVEEQGQSQSDVIPATLTDTGTIEEPPLLTIPDDARTDERGFALTKMREPFSDIAQRLYSHNWYVQNPAVVDLMTQGLPDDLGSSFILGRALLQAADGSAWRADRFLRDYDGLSTDADKNHQAFLAGAAFECCFDRTGTKRDDFKFDYLPLIFWLMSKEKWALARRDFLSRINSFREIFYWLPDKPLPQVSIFVAVSQMVQGEVTSIRLSIEGEDEKELLASSSRTNNTKISFDEDRLKRAIEQRTLIPSESISLEYAPQEPIDFVYYPEDKRLDLEVIPGKKLN
ncbi:PIN-like domain-containing protein [Xanthomonas campestris]|uniref:PIN-like domain-containing protein n=2 Tax=Xanthomonas campestris TaxID=339 RepID=UPI002B23C11E|nr:PIN-like domain-containing protein [Xanthomonas campestris]